MRLFLGIPIMRLITQFNGTSPATLAKVDSRYPTTARSARGYILRTTAPMSFGGPGGGFACGHGLYHVSGIAGYVRYLVQAGEVQHWGYSNPGRQTEL